MTLGIIQGRKGVHLDHGFRLPPIFALAQAETFGRPVALGGSSLGIAVAAGFAARWRQ